jgi:S1-C subfamily serine protease
METAEVRKTSGTAAALLLYLGLLLVNGGAQAQTAARDLFESSRDLVYQVRVIDLASADQFSIGSGFAVDNDGRIASNFHVVSSFVHEPEKFRLEAVAADDTVYPLTLLAIDVVHDLAILSTGQGGESYLPLATREPEQGDRIYSLGNPLDLGMTIIEGTYNGLVENSRYRKILFSGSLNPGMSGGPALNGDGEVMGINVAKGAEQISFLVPVDHLARLLARSVTPQMTDLSAEITAALLADQQAFYDSILAGLDRRKPLGDIEILDKMTDSLRCWGHLVDEEDLPYEAVHQHCKSEDLIFVAEDLVVGDFSYDVELIETTELNPLQFYNLLEERFDHPGIYNTTDTSAVSAWSCHTDRVALDSGSWKMSSCLRTYADFGGLYDASMAMISLDYGARAAMIQVGASGISRDNALALFRGVSGAVSWTR